MSNLMVRRSAGRQLPAVNREADLFKPFGDLWFLNPFEEFTVPPFSPKTFIPPFEIKETKDAFVFKADVPGVKDTDLEVQVVGNRLNVIGKREEEKEERGESFHTYERSYGNFARSFTLPDGIDAEHVLADLRAGVLIITMPKMPEVKPKSIPIKTATQSAKA
jgi:HSP20 family protein